MKSIALSNGKFALVDDDEFDRLSRFRWHETKSGRGLSYAYRAVKNCGKQKNFLMHREILRLTDSNVFCDHKNHDGLDNRKSNLRICTPSQNLMNRRKSGRPSSSKYKGVSWHRSRGWRATIKINGKATHLGYAETEAKAAEIYDTKAIELFGEFALPNFKRKVNA